MILSSRDVLSCFQELSATGFVAIDLLGRTLIYFFFEWQRKNVSVREIRR